MGYRFTQTAPVFITNFKTLYSNIVDVVNFDIKRRPRLSLK